MIGERGQCGGCVLCAIYRGIDLSFNFTDLFGGYLAKVFRFIFWRIRRPWKYQLISWLGFAFILLIKPSTILLQLVEFSISIKVICYS